MSTDTNVTLDHPAEEETAQDPVRRIILGAAWSAPVILAATALPMAAASMPPAKSDLKVRWHNFSPTASIPATQGGVQGNLGFGVEWSESTELVVVTYRVTLENLDGTGSITLITDNAVLGRSQSKDAIQFRNTADHPLTPGKSYRVIGYVNAVEQKSGKVVDIYDKKGKLLLPAWIETITAQQY